MRETLKNTICFGLRQNNNLFDKSSTAHFVSLLLIVLFLTHFRLRKAEREKRRLQNERNRERNAQRVSASKLDLAILEAAEVEEINSTTEIEEKVDEASLDLYTPKGHKIVFPNNEIPKKRTRSFRKGDFKVSVLKETNDPLLAPNYEKKLSQRKRDWINRQSVPRASKRRRPLTY